MEDDLPLWWKVINIEDNQFERSKYADKSGESKFRIKDLTWLRKLAPSVYESAAGEVKEYNEYVAQESGNKFKKYKLGKKIGSIPIWDAALHPELMHDKAAQNRYWSENNAFKVKY